VKDRLNRREYSQMVDPKTQQVMQAQSKLSSQRSTEGENPYLRHLTNEKHLVENSVIMGETHLRSLNNLRPQSSTDHFIRLD